MTPGLFCASRGQRLSQSTESALDSITNARRFVVECSSRRNAYLSTLQPKAPSHWKVAFESVFRGCDFRKIEHVLGLFCESHARNKLSRVKEAAVTGGVKMEEVSGMLTDQWQVQSFQK